MNQAPRKQSETGLFAEVWKEYNRLLDYIREISPKSGFGIRTNRSMNGTTIAVDKQVVDATPAQPVQWKGEWKNQVYEKNDIVIRGSANQSSAGWNDTDAILTDGTKAGVYIALQPVPAGTPAPAEPNSATYWETLARFATHILAVKKTGSADISGVPQSILLDGSNPSGAVRIKLSDCNAKVLTVREVEVCVAGQTMHMMVIGSAPY